MDYTFLQPKKSKHENDAIYVDCAKELVLKRRSFLTQFIFHSKKEACAHAPFVFLSSSASQLVKKIGHFLLVNSNVYFLEEVMFFSFGSLRTSIIFIFLSTFLTGFFPWLLVCIATNKFNEKKIWRIGNFCHALHLCSAYVVPIVLFQEYIILWGLSLYLSLYI